MFLTDRTAWRDAMLIWLGQYALFFMLSYLAADILYLHGRFGTWNAIVAAQQNGGQRGFDMPVIGSWIA